MPCYRKIAGPTLHGTAMGVITAILFNNRAMRHQGGITIAAGALIGATVGVVEAKRAGCLDKKRPEPPPVVQGH